MSQLQGVETDGCSDKGKKCHNFQKAYIYSSVQRTVMDDNMIYVGDNRTYYSAAIKVLAIFLIILLVFIAYSQGKQVSCTTTGAQSNETIFDKQEYCAPICAAEANLYLNAYMEETIIMDGFMDDWLALDLKTEHINSSSYTLVKHITPENLFMLFIPTGKTPYKKSFIINPQLRKSDNKEPNNMTPWNLTIGPVGIATIENIIPQDPNVAVQTEDVPSVVYGVVVEVKIPLSSLGIEYGENKSVITLMESFGKDKSAIAAFLME